MDKKKLKKIVIASIKSIKRKAQQIAPAPVKTPVKTPSPAPQKSPDKTTPTHNPFQPPRPKVMPKPKARNFSNNYSESSNTETDQGRLPTVSSELKRLLKNAQQYEANSHPSGQKFWGNIPEDHPFAQNPILSVYGNQLSKENYDDLVQKMQGGQGRVYGHNEVPQMMQEAMTLFRKIEALEGKNREKLIDAAKDITCEVWGIDRSLLDASLGGTPENQGGDGGGQKAKAPMTPKLRAEVNKRITMNALTQGSAVHAMQTAHHLIKQALDEVSPELVKMYTRIANVSTHSYYLFDLDMIMKMLASGNTSAAIGWSHVDFKEEQPKVVAQGKCFPVLVQELFKGVMELLSLHGINQDLTEEELNTVYDAADRTEDEPWLIMVGPALWRRFLKVLPKGVSLAEIVSRFSKETPEAVYRYISQVIQNQEEAKNTFDKYKPVPPGPKKEEEPQWVDEPAQGNSGIPLDEM